MKTEIAGYEFTNADEVRCILKAACTDLSDAEWDSFIAQTESALERWLQLPESQKNKSKCEFVFPIRRRKIGIWVIPECVNSCNQVKLQLCDEDERILSYGPINANIFYTGTQGDKK